MEGKVIVVTSGKRGVGKTTVTANIGAGLVIEGTEIIMMRHRRVRHHEKGIKLIIQLFGEDILR